MLEPFFIQVISRLLGVEYVCTSVLTSILVKLQGNYEMHQNTRKLSSTGTVHNFSHRSLMGCTIGDRYRLMASVSNGSIYILPLCLKSRCSSIDQLTLLWLLAAHLVW